MRLQTWILSGLAMAAALPAAAEPLRIVYVERAPYYYTENSEAKGTILDLMRTIAAKAGVEIKLSAAASKRILADLEGNALPFCSVNWNRTEAREKIGKFSIAAFQGEALVIVTRKEREAELRKHDTWKSVTQDPALKLGAVDGWALGPYVDGLMAAMKGNIDKANVTPAQNLAKVGAGRVTYTLIDDGEVDYAIKTAGLDPKDFASLKYSDMPYQPAAYIWCSKSVADSDITRFNAAINELYPGGVK